MTVYLPLATSADYASLIGPIPAGVNIDTLCVAASARVRAYCGWHIATSVTEAFTVNGSGTFRQFLPSLFLTDVASVSDSGGVLDLTQLDWATEGYIEWAQYSPGFPRSYGFPGMFSRRPRGIVATVTHGYPLVPQDLVALVCTVVARQAASPSGVLREQAGQVSAAYSQVAPNVAGGITLLKNEMSDLDDYRIPRFR